jgi:hypothetical protein
MTGTGDFRGIEIHPMPMAKGDHVRVCELLADDRRFAELEALLLNGSHLPGPRGNLELAAAFADCIAAEHLTEPQWALLTAWLALADDEAPGGDRHEFLPFCAALALGASFIDADEERKGEIVQRLREIANDGRWRMREAVAMALQRIGERDFAVLTSILDGWLPDANHLEQRAIVAALAHPPLLRSPDRVRYCLDVTDRIVMNLPAVDADERRSAAFAVLKKGLSYAPSVFVAAAPHEGFSLLERWAQSSDRDVKVIIGANLKKNRLARPFAAEVARVAAALR